MSRRPTLEAINMASEKEALVVDRLVVRYGKIGAIRGASLRVGCGEVAAVIGANSAGKSSLLEGIGARIPGRTVVGSATFSGLPLLGLNTRERWQAGVRLVPQGRQIYPSLSVADNLRVIAENVGVAWRNAVESSFALFPPEFS
jgi:branched-chain amino acid transport system ATP-binding protein